MDQKLTNQLITEGLKYSRHSARRRQCPTNNMFKVWQNLANTGGRPISTAVEVLLTKIINWQLSVLLIVVFFVAAAVSIITQPNIAESMILSAGGAESMMLSALTLRVSYSQRRHWEHHTLSAARWEHHTLSAARWCNLQTVPRRVDDAPTMCCVLK